MVSSPILSNSITGKTRLLLVIITNLGYSKEEDLQSVTYEANITTVQCGETENINLTDWPQGKALFPSGLWGDSSAWSCQESGDEDHQQPPLARTSITILRHKYMCCTNTQLCTYKPDIRDSLLSSKLSMIVYIVMMRNITFTRMITICQVIN